MEIVGFHAYLFGFYNNVVKGYIKSYKRNNKNYGILFKAKYFNIICRPRRRKIKLIPRVWFKEDAMKKL